MKLLNFTIIKLAICISIGVLIGYFFKISLLVSITVCVFLLSIVSAFYLLNRKQFTKTIWYGMAVFVTMIAVGILTVNLHDHKNFKNHYSNYVSAKSDSLTTISFRIREVLKSGNYYDKYIVEVLNVNENKTVGRSLINIKKGSLECNLDVDECYLAKAKFRALIHPQNPGQFDYKKYLERKYIYHQLFVDGHRLLKVKSRDITILGIANTIRAHINSKLKPYNFKPDEVAIINALLLGQRQDISKAIHASYTNSGAIHILAVSGLHVGILMLMLSFLLKPLEYFKYGKYFKALLIVVILWCFALITGLSASVTRAVTMFSIVAIGLNLKRPTNIYNTLAISIFVLLLFKPLFLFDVGFQLSYLAVFAIVALDPILYKLWQPKHWFLDTYWHTFTITLTAQFGIIPLSLFYFNQFPGLFFVSNLVIIPLLGIVLGLGVVVIFMALLNILPNILAKTFGVMVSCMNDFVMWISQKEAFIFKDISFNFLYVVITYVTIISLLRFLLKRNFTNLRLVLIAIILMQCAVIYTNYNMPNNQFIVFHKSRHSLIGKIKHKEIAIAHDFDSLTKAKNNIIRDYCVKNAINTVVEDTLKAVYFLDKKRLLVIDSLNICNLKTLKPYYILLRQSPKINLNRVIDSLHPKQIIADGSNYRSYMEHWEKVCEKRKLPFHQTSKKGAFVIKY